MSLPWNWLRSNAQHSGSRNAHVHNTRITNDYAYPIRVVMCIQTNVKRTLISFDATAFISICSHRPHVLGLLETAIWSLSTARGWYLSLALTCSRCSSILFASKHVVICSIHSLVSRTCDHRVTSTWSLRPAGCDARANHELNNLRINPWANESKYIDFDCLKWHDFPPKLF